MATNSRTEAQRPYATLCQGDALAVWCAQWLGAPPTRVLFEAAHLSIVTGLRLVDGREVVVKARPLDVHFVSPALVGAGLVPAQPRATTRVAPTERLVVYL